MCDPLGQGECLNAYDLSCVVHYGGVYCGFLGFVNQRVRAIEGASRMEFSRCMTIDLPNAGYT